MRIIILLTFSMFSAFCFSQKQDKNWYFGLGTDGIVFNNQNVPIKVSNKYPGVGFEGNAVASDPCTGQLLFYTDGIKVIDQNHNLMINGTGLLSNLSGSQCVQICKIPGTCNKYYIISNSSWDNTPGSFYYSIADFSSNPLGEITIKNQYINGPNYHQAMRIIPKTNSNNLWLIGHIYNTATYHVFEVTPTGIIGPVIYNFLNAGKSWTMEYNSVTQKLVNMGENNLGVSLFDFDPNTGILSNEQQLYFGPMTGAVGNFSPDGSKLYVGLSVGVGAGVLWQYDMNSTTWTNMNTCCWAHDIKTGPDGITYYIHTFNNPNPLAKITNANLSAVGNACGYSTITNPGNFNGEVRRFPEFLQVPNPPVADLDTLTYFGGTVSINVMGNDFDPQSDPISISAIISGPTNGTASINNGEITYTANSGVCNITDTIIYEIVDITCMCDTAKIIVNIPGVSPLSSFNYSQQSCTGNVDFTNNSNGISQEWNFGDGSPFQNSVNASHTFAQPGTYAVSLITYNSCGSDTLIDSVVISFDLPTTASFNFAQLNCSSIINFTNLSQNSSSLYWIFGDGFIDTASNPSHTYSIPGNYNVSLIVLNVCSSDTLTQTVSVGTIPRPTLSMSYVQQNCSSTVDFSNFSTNAVSYLWDFGDGTTSTLQNVTHTYPTFGTFSVLLIAHGTCVYDTLSNIVSLISSPQVISQFNSTTEGCSYNVNFSNQSLNATNYSWDFGDSTYSLVPNPSHLYSDTGTYAVKLISSNGCGTDTTIQIIPMYISRGVAEFDYHQPICESTVQFTNQSLNGFSQLWNFGDGFINRTENPSHGYKSAGMYNVTLSINRGSLCEDTITLQIATTGPYKPNLYIPNCFTPNGDGLNDVFRIVSENSCGDLQLFIFNRWGNVIYETNEIYPSWDGLFNGNPLPEGVYCYLIKGEEYNKTGTIAIIR